MRPYLLIALLCCVGCTKMGREHELESARAAWARIRLLGGHGVWEPDLVVVSLSGTGISNDDLTVFADFPCVEILDISSNPLTDDALKHLEALQSLETLVACDTQISDGAFAAFRSSHPNVEVKTQPPPTSTVNPFTGKPIGE